MVIRHRRVGVTILLALVSSMLFPTPHLFGQQQKGESESRSKQRPKTENAKTAEPADSSKPGDEQEPQGATSGGLKKWVQDRYRTMSAAGSRERGITYAAGTVEPGSGVAAGIGYKDLNAFSPGLGFEAGGMLSLRRYQEYAGAIGWLRDRSSTLELDTADGRVGSLFNASSKKEAGSSAYLDVRYRDFPQHIYNGVGLASTKDDRTDYSLSGVSIDGVLQRQFTRTLGLSLRGGLLDLRVGKGTNPSLVNFEDRFNEASIPGALTQPLYLTIGAGFVRDTRTQPAAPEGGTMVGVAVRRFDSRNADDFTRTTVEARGYLRPGTPRGVVALRALLSADFTDSGGQTPFYLQQSLGGGDTVRGFKSYRFQDQALYVLSAEYRWRLHRFIEIASFVDAGNVAPRVRSLTLHSLKVAPGVAIRARTDHATLFRLEWATSSEGYRFVFGAGPAF